MSTLANVLASRAAVAARPVAFPYRPGTIPRATKARVLRKLNKDVLMELRRVRGGPLHVEGGRVVTPGTVIAAEFASRRAAEQALADTGWRLSEGRWWA